MKNVRSDFRYVERQIQPSRQERRIERYTWWIDKGDPG